ncbi:MAG: C40 family peptidase [Rectinemataceae bacterium]
MLILGSAVLAIPGFAEPPMAVPIAKESRNKLVSNAERYLGKPYAYGGSNAAGFDCSGLVYRVYKDVLGVAVPRTTQTLHRYVEPIPVGKLQPGDLVFFDTTSRLAHVGIYIGEGSFIHSASEGTKRGVIRSSLSEPYWKRSFADAGRLISPAEYLGILLSMAAGPQIGADSALRGGAAALVAAFPLGSVEPGIQLLPSWDAGLGVLRLPLQLSLGLDRHLRFFAGPAFTLGVPRTGGENGLSYSPEGGVIGSAGVAYAPFEWRIREQRWRLLGMLTYDHYVASASGTANQATGFGVGLKAGLMLEMRFLQ